MFFLFQDGFTLFRAPREAIWPAEGLLCFYQEGSSDFGRHDHLQTGLGVLPSWAFRVAPVKNPPAMRETRDRSLRGEDPPAMRETRDRSLGGEDPLEEGIVTHSSILAWRIPMDRRAWQATVHRVAKSWTRLK